MSCRVPTYLLCSHIFMDEYFPPSLPSRCYALVRMHNSQSNYSPRHDPNSKQFGGIHSFLPDGTFRNFRAFKPVDRLLLITFWGSWVMECSVGFLPSFPNHICTHIYRRTTTYTTLQGRLAIAKPMYLILLLFSWLAMSVVSGVLLLQLSAIANSKFPACLRRMWNHLVWNGILGGMGWLEHTYLGIAALLFPVSQIHHTLLSGLKVWMWRILCS